MRKALVAEFADGSADVGLMRLLEMVRYDGADWVPIEATESQLEAVEIDGENVYWDDLCQDFRLSDLEAGIYGRKLWIDRPDQKMAIVF